MRRRRSRRVAAAFVVAALLLAGALAMAEVGARRDLAHDAYDVGHVTEVSVGCPGTGDSTDAADPARDEVFQAFEGCDHDNGVALAVSDSGGESYSRPVVLPGSYGGWDPALAVAPNGTVYAAFMNTVGTRTYPLLDVSHDGGRTFDLERSLRPRQANNWGDAEYLAVSSRGTLYVAWDYGPSDSEVKSSCSPAGSCWATNGDLNVVVQRSRDEGRRFSPMSVVSPGYPDAGADEGDVTVAPNGAVDVLYQGYRMVKRSTLSLADGHEFFTASRDGGTRWSRPVAVGAGAGRITINEWWNDGSVGCDAAGTLYATWDTQSESSGRMSDVGWLSFSEDGGRRWARPVMATLGPGNLPHIVEVVGAGRGRAYVAWMSHSEVSGYALYLRTFRAPRPGGNGGWLSPPVRISPPGSPRGFPGDTFGLVIESTNRLSVSWGAAMPGSHGNSFLYSEVVRVT